jgi:hypothetical protein
VTDPVFVKELRETQAAAIAAVRVVTEVLQRLDSLVLRAEDALEPIPESELPPGTVPNAELIGRESVREQEAARAAFAPVPVQLPPAAQQLASQLAPVRRYGLRGIDQAVLEKHKRETDAAISANPNPGVHRGAQVRPPAEPPAPELSPAEALARNPNPGVRRG